MTFQIFKLFKANSTQTISKSLNVSATEYVTRDILELPLTKESKQFVFENRLTSFSDLLNMTFLELRTLTKENYFVGLELLANCRTICEENTNTKESQKQEINSQNKINSLSISASKIEKNKTQTQAKTKHNVFQPNSIDQEQEEITSSEAIDIKLMTEYYDRLSTKKIADILNINSDNFHNISINRIQLSERANKCLSDKSIYFCSQLLNKTFRDLILLPGCTRNIAIELMQACLDVVEKGISSDSFLSLSIEKKNKDAKKDSKPVAESEVLQEKQETKVTEKQNTENFLNYLNQCYKEETNKTIAETLGVNAMDFISVPIDLECNNVIKLGKETRWCLLKHQVRNYSDLLNCKLCELSTWKIKTKALTDLLSNCEVIVKNFPLNIDRLEQNKLTNYQRQNDLANDTILNKISSQSYKILPIETKTEEACEDEKMNILIQCYNARSSTRISSALGSDKVEYRIRIEHTKLSTEAKDCLIRRHIFSYSQLLDLSFDELASWPDCSRNTGLELLERCKEITDRYSISKSEDVSGSEDTSCSSGDIKSEVKTKQETLFKEADNQHSKNNLFVDSDEYITELENSSDLLSLIRLYDSNSTETIAKAISINDLEYFDTIDIFKNSKFSVRTSNCIKTKKIKTYGELFRLSFRDIKGWRNLGKKSASELLNQCLIISKKNQIHQSYSFSIINALLQDLLSYCQQCTIEEDRIEVINSLLRILPETYGKRDIIASYIDNFYLKEKNTEELINKAKNSNILKDKYISPFISAYERCYQGTKIKLEVNDTSTFENYTFPLEDQMINSFLKWATQDINTYSLDTFFCVKETKKLSILKAIANGETLESIGNVQGITRERVRQIYKKSIAKIKSNISYGSLFYWLYAYNKAESIIEIDSFQDLIREENRNLFIPIIKRGDLDKEGDWHYEKKYNALVFDFIGDNIVRSLEKEISFLPSEINNDDMDSHILQIQEKLGCKLAFILKEIESQFFKYKYFYSRKKYNFKDMCLYIVREHFPNGIHISEKEDYDRLCNFLTDLFDFDSTGYSDAHVKNVINETCTLCGEGTYKPKIQVSEKNNNIIRNFIEYSFSLGRTALYFNEIFIKLGKDLDTALIENQYVLHDIISDLNLPYEITRNYIKKEANSNIVDDITFYVRENWPITKDKVINYFCMSDTQFNQLLCKCSKIKLRGKMLVYQSQISDSKS